MGVNTGDLALALQAMFSPTLQSQVTPGTPLLAEVPILRTYGSAAEYFTPPYTGRMYVVAAFSAAVDLQIARNASSASPIYNSFLGGQNAQAASEYEFDLSVDPSDVIDLEVDANVTVNLLKISFRRGS